MDAPTFEWDPAKAAANLQTHGVSFEEAATVFQEPGIAPAILAANIIVITGFALLAGTVGAMMAHAIRRRSASKS